jgi:lipopolysaccharide exporter
MTVPSTPAGTVAARRSRTRRPSYVGIEEKALRGIPWTLGTFASSKLITLGTTVVLARLLVPADFGIVALAVLAVGLFNIFSTLGLSGALIQRQDLGERGKGTVLSLLLVQGAALALVLVALAPLAADVFSQPRLTGVLAAMSSIVFVSGFTVFYETVLQRELEFRRRFRVYMIQSLTYAGVAIPLAASGAGVWSLVVGQIASTIGYGAALYSLAPYRVRPVFDRAEALSVFRSGRGFLLQGTLAFFEQNTDYIAVGNVLGSTQLGLYSMAYRLSELPNQSISEPVATVTFPAFARMRHRGEDVASSFLSTFRMVALVTCPLGVFLSAAADPFTTAILGDRWLEMIGPLSILGVWAIGRSVDTTIGWLLNSVGEAGLVGTVAAVLLIPLIPALFVAAELGGLDLVAWVMVADTVVALLVMAFLASRRAGIGMREQWRALAPIAIACAITWATVWLVARATDSVSPGVSLAACVVTWVVSYGGTLSLIQPGLLRDALGGVLRIVGRTPDGTPQPG